MDIKSGYFLSDGNAVNVILGFVPDFLMLYADFVGAPTLVQFSRCVNAAGITGQYGFQDGSTGDWVAADQGSGVVPFDTSYNNYVMVESPRPGIGKLAVATNLWTASTAWTARSATVIGSIIVPTTRNGYVYECTTYSSADGTPEPTWPTTPGTTVAEAVSTNVFTCRKAEFTRAGGKGFTYGGDEQTDGEYVHFIAFKTNKDRYLGDAADGDLSLI